MFRFFKKFGITVKVAIIIAALDIFYISSVQILNQHRLGSLLVEQELNEMEVEVRKTSDMLASKIKTLRRDVTVLAGMPPIQGIVRARQAGGIDPRDGSSKDEWEKRLSTIFQAMQRTKPNYIEIAYVNVQDSADKLVKVGQTGDGYAFEESFDKLEPHTVHLSGIKQITNAAQSDKSAVTIVQGIFPVFESEQVLFGYIKIVLNLRAEFELLESTLSEERMLLIADDKGYLNFVSGDRGSLSLGHVNRLDSVFPDIFKDNDRSTADSNTAVINDNNSNLHTVSVRKQRFDSEHPNRALWLALATPYDHVVALTLSMRNQSVLYGGVFLSISLCFSVLLSRLFTGPLKRITIAVKDFENNRIPADLPVDQTDEIGILARAFDNLVKNSKQRNQQIEAEIAERKQVETALRESDKTFRQIVDHIGQLLWMCSSDGKRVFYVSLAYQRIWGRASQDLYDNPKIWLQAIHPDDRSKATKAFTEKAIKGIEYTLDYRILRPDGGVRWIHDHAFPIHDINGRVKNIAGFAQDITEHKEMEEERRLAQKLEAVGQLAAGIAHEINTPAQYVADNTRFLKESLSQIVRINYCFGELLLAAHNDTITPELVAKTESIVAESDLDYLMEEIPQAIDEASDGIQQISRIVKAMKEFSHPGGKQREFSDVNRIIENTITVTRNEWKYVANLETELDENLPLIPCFPQLIGQVVLNLIVNAAHAIKGASSENTDELGTITVITRSHADRVEIIVADTGTGIDDSVRDKIFDPFFTTKEVGKGTGQGLALVRSAIIDRHGGSINVDTEIGKGTTFVIGLSTVVEAELEPEELA